MREGIFMVFAGRDNAQSFVAGRTGRLDRVDLRLAQNVGPDSAEQVAVRIQGAEGYFAVPTSQVLSETSVAATDVTPDYGWTSVELSEPVSVVEGQSYAIVLSATVKDIEAFAWAYTEHEAYAGGIASMITTTDEDPGWGHRIDQDMNFRTYVDAGIDADDDGFGTFQECDDTDPAVNPDAAETYNQVDDDCDEEVDEGFTVAGAPGIGSAQQRHDRRRRQRHGALDSPHQQRRPADHRLQGPGTEAERRRSRRHPGHQDHKSRGTVVGRQAHRRPLQVPRGGAQRRGPERLVGELRHRQELADARSGGRRGGRRLFNPAQGLGPLLELAAVSR